MKCLIGIFSLSYSLISSLVCFFPRRISSLALLEIGLPHGILALAFESRIGIPSIERYRMELVNVYAERRQVYLTFDIKL